jgi:hypothetical protein
MSNKPKDGSGKKDTGEDLMKAVMQMLESSSKSIEEKKAAAKKKMEAKKMEAKKKISK